MATHAHSSNQPAGSKYDRKNRTDVTGSNSSTVGQPFAHFGHHPPMIHTAPIHSMSTPHARINCPECFRAIQWDGHTPAFACGGCGATVEP